MRVLLFVGLKIVEGMGVLGLFYWFYLVGKWVNAESMETWHECILIGFVTHILVWSGGFVVVLSSYRLCLKNWEWVNRILKK